ncbi:MAG: hypothetical protein J5I90_21480 [Caldilineales bacterium]|nr:hypothetical protein [Caldilineales bacterium]
MTSEAIKLYHRLLDDEMGQDSQAQLDAQQQKRGLFFGERPLTTVLRPRFLSFAQFRYLQVQVALLLRAFDKIHQAALADDRVRAQFRLTDWEEELVHVDPGFRTPTPLSRLDAFFNPETNELKFTEYNAETPAAPAYNDQLSNVFYGLPVMGEFMKTYQVRSLPARVGVLHALLDAYTQWRGHRERPRIAILDWREVPTYSEFGLFFNYFESQGLKTIITDPREVEYRNGRLMAGDFEIDLIYKRVLISELVQWGGLDNDVIRAVRAGDVCMVNPFTCKMLYKKASLAVLSDERNAHLFTRDENHAISLHIPWTRVVEERRTQFDNQDIDLIPFIQANRDRLVLKPNDDYGGHGIVLGWTVDASEWEAALATALAADYIVQEKIAIPSEPYPSLIDDKVTFIDRMFDTAPFCFHGEFMASCLTRLSTVELLNVTAGGGSSVPTFVIDKR